MMNAIKSFVFFLIVLQVSLLAQAQTPKPLTKEDIGIANQLSTKLG